MPVREASAAFYGPPIGSARQAAAIDSEVELWNKLDLTRGVTTLPPACFTTWAR